MSLKHAVTPLSAWAQALSKPFTVPRHETRREAAAAYRGFHQNETELCTGCGLCARVCMNEAIQMVAVDEKKAGDKGVRPRIDYGRCCWCALCVDACSKDALRMSDEYVWVSCDATEFVYTPGVDDKPWDGSERGWRNEASCDEKGAREK